MYDVEVKQIFLQPSGDGQPLHEQIDAEWEECLIVPQLDNPDAELAEAKRVAAKLREYHRSVRIVKWTSHGLREVVQECPFDQAHTRDWCGNSGCRES